MALSKLKLNPDKTEFIVFGSKAQHQKLSSHFPVNIFDTTVADIVKNLNMCFNADISFSVYVQKTCKAFLQMCDLGRIRKCFAEEVAVLATNSIVNSRPDYCIFRGLSGFTQQKLQSHQNMLARIVTNQSMLMSHPPKSLIPVLWVILDHPCL